MVKKVVAKLGTGTYRRREVGPVEEPADSQAASKRFSEEKFSSSVRRAIGLFLQLDPAGYIDDEGFVHIIFEEIPELPKLPEYYALKGGAVREFLRRRIFPDTPALKIRDYDIVRFANSPDTHDHEVAMRYMIEDYEYGHGVEVVEDLSVYFRTRDLSCNELLLSRQELICTERALVDICQNIIRPCDHVINRSGEVDGRTFVKALRFVAEAAVANIHMQLVGFDSIDRITPFDLALHLDRAFGCHQSVAQEFIELSWRAELLFPKHQVPPASAHVVRYLSERLTQGVGFFKHLPKNIVQSLAL